MSAIITETFRRNNTKAFLSELADVANNFYIGIGKSDPWPTINGADENALGYEVAAPLGTYSDRAELLNNLTTLIGVTGNTYSQVIPNIPAKTSHRHKAYNPFDPDCFYQTTVDAVQKYPCYVVVNDNVYICLKEAKDAATSYSFPDGVTITRGPFKLVGDDSVWAYVYNVKAEFPINSSQFISTTVTPTYDTGEVAGDLVTGTGNLVYGFSVIDGGSGFTSTPTVEFVSDTGAVTALTATVTNNVVTKVDYSGAVDPSTWIKESGYVKITGGGGTGAKVYPHVAPATGFGFNPADDLPSWYAGIAVQAIETIYDDGAFIPYRQVSIIKNPENEVGVADPELSLNCLYRLELPSDPTTIPVSGNIITQAATGAIGIVDHYDATNKYLYYHQTYETGFIPFVITSTVSINVGAGNTVVPDAVTVSEYVKGTGEVVFAENRKAISRTSGQTEDITIILQF